MYNTRQHYQTPKHPLTALAPTASEIELTLELHKRAMTIAERMKHNFNVHGHLRLDGLTIGGSEVQLIVLIDNLTAYEWRLDHDGKHRHTFYEMSLVKVALRLLSKYMVLDDLADV
jgi:hypothetical protein